LLSRTVIRMNYLNFMTIVANKDFDVSSREPQKMIHKQMRSKILLKFVSQDSVVYKSY